MGACPQTGTVHGLALRIMPSKPRATPTRVHVVYNLSKRQWYNQAGSAATPWSVPPPVTQTSLQNVSVKGRSSHEEKEAWAKGAEVLLGTQPWVIGRPTKFAEVEQLVVVLAVRARIRCDPRSYACLTAVLHCAEIPRPLDISQKHEHLVVRWCQLAGNIRC